MQRLRAHLVRSLTILLKKLIISTRIIFFKKKIKQETLPLWPNGVAESPHSATPGVGRNHLEIVRGWFGHQVKAGNY